MEDQNEKPRLCRNAKAFVVRSLLGLEVTRCWELELVRYSTWGNSPMLEWTDGSLEVVLLHLVSKRISTDLQESGSSCLVTVGVLERLFEKVLFNLLKTSAFGWQTHQSSARSTRHGNR